MEYLNDTRSETEEIIYSMNINHYEADSYLFKPGEDIDTILFVAEGEIEIAFTVNDKNLTMRMLRNGMISEEN